MKPEKGTYPFVGSAGPGDLDVEGDWEGPIELFEFEDEEQGWLNCTRGYYWHPVLGGGIYQHEGEWYQNWEFDTQQEEPKVPQDPPKGGTTVQQVGNVGGRKMTTPRRSSARQSRPSQPKPPCPPRCLKPQTDPDPTTPLKTRRQQLSKNPLAPLTQEEAKTRENNIAHIKHLKEAMKDLIEKWNVAIQREKDWTEEESMKVDKERLEHWLEDIEMVLRATKMSPVYIPDVREQWIKAVKQKPPSIPEDPENPSEQPKKLMDPKPVRKHVAKKSGTGCQRARKKDEDKEGEPQQILNIPLQSGDTLEEPTDDPLSPGPDPKNSQPLSTDPKDLSRSKQKPKSTARATPKGVKPKSTAGMTSEGQDRSIIGYL